MSSKEILEQNRADIVRKYQSGVSTNKLAKEYGCNPGSVYTFLQSLGIEIKKGNWGVLNQQKDLVISLYQQGLSAEKIAKQVGAQKPSVLKFLKKNGIDTSQKNTCKGKPHLTEFKDKVIEMYRSGMNGSEIAQQLGYAASAVTVLLGKNNIEIRDDRYEVDESFFEKIDTEEKAYVLGWMYSDGNVFKDMFRIQIADLSILEKIKSILKFEGPIQDVPPPKKFPHRKVQYVMTICRKKMVEDLAKLGVLPAKSLTITFPTEQQVPTHLLGPFLRGVYDGDGSIAKSAAGGFNISLTCTLDFANKVIEVTNCPNFKLYCRFPDRQNSTRSLASGEKETVRRFLDFIYKDATVYLQRKYDLYTELISQG